MSASPKVLCIPPTALEDPYSSGMIVIWWRSWGVDGLIIEDGSQNEMDMKPQPFLAIDLGSGISAAVWIASRLDLL